jgi:uncharacterized protein YegJ (DUF2314 family)
MPWRIMTSAGYAVLLSAGLAAGLHPRPAHAQTITQNAEHDELAIVAKKDPAMAKAMTKARQTLPDFLSTAADGDNVEYFWITPFTSTDGKFSGEINNKPRSVRSVKLGQTITFEQSEIVDWTYMDGDKMKGNYTACALLESASKQEAEEFKQRFGLDCDF